MFKVGDRVRFPAYQGCDPGEGTIVVTGSYSNGVKADISQPCFHSLYGLTTAGFGWYIPGELLTLINPILEYDPAQQGDRDDDI
jgi:hypothetical protein